MKPPRATTSVEAAISTSVDALQHLAELTRRIGVDTKSPTLLTVLEIGFE